LRDNELRKAFLIREKPLSTLPGDEA
jgi:hypothetical protein